MRKLSDFEGRWTLTRVITPAVGDPARFEGTAVWTPEAGGLAYFEDGQLHLSGQPSMMAQRRYYWDAQLCVHFEDGRFFHQVPPTGGATGHWCDPDQYDVVYDFEGWQSGGTRSKDQVERPMEAPVEWTVDWQVKGPRKDYTMHSIYRRVLSET